MKISEFDYQLPKELIAQKPVEPRDVSRLMVIDKKRSIIAHSFFKNLTDYLKKGDCLVLNNTRVFPARLFGYKKTGGAVELLLISEEDKNHWRALVKPGRQLPVGTEIIFDDGLLYARIEEKLEEGERIILFRFDGDFNHILKSIGKIPLPPYIHEELSDEERYQTIFSREEKSTAAPTAGLHFTPQLLNEIKEKGVCIAEIDLKIGLDTFMPVKVDNIKEHKMHSEYFKLDKETASKINRAIKKGGRIVAVGTTVVRTLETVSCLSDLKKEIKADEGRTNLFIYPGYKFKIVDVLITNFHLPRSTLLMLVCAFGGKDLIMKAYEEAISKNYRFFSFGDAMLIS
ncbi:MAG: tRNA preQ1(34) S-adenosylmethionine ribosyltransferase-isomerase QueA [Actinobacteria bacterium]|nr:tRNA preQ1(34) S-adenosylmethionine ribosyltransferase-isomerase QueA [Actinomycetota bacterium]